jgi:1-acyl-sn-glycerol-3-phosphate acyltransferase
MQGAPSRHSARVAADNGKPAGAGESGERAGPLSGLARAIRDEVANRIPRADPHERDPDYIRDNLPWLWLLASFYFRSEVRGLERIPAQGPVLLVGNHSGGNMIPDTFIFVLAFSSFFGVERRFFQLAHNLVLASPGLGRLRKGGVMAASRENAEMALDSGSVLLDYPGGDYETHRPSWQSATVDFGGRKGFIRLAIAKDVPIVPVVSIGGQETALFLTRGERLARLLRLDRLFRLKVLPISLAPPWGLNVGDLAGHIPLPAKITIEVLEPIDIRAEFGDEPDLDLVYDAVVERMQRALDALAAERRLPLIG